MTGRRDNRYTTRPGALLLLILKAHCQNKGYQLCDDLLTSVLDYALSSGSLVTIVTSFGRYLVVLRAVVQGYVKNIETTYCGKNCRLLPRQVDAKLITQLSSCYKLLYRFCLPHHYDAKPTTQSSSCRKPKFNDRSCINLDAMLTTQFSSYCKRKVKINMDNLRSK